METATVNHYTRPMMTGRALLQFAEISLSVAERERTTKRANTPAPAKPAVPSTIVRFWEECACGKNATTTPNEAAATSDVLAPVQTVPVTLRGQSTALAFSPVDMTAVIDLTKCLCEKNSTTTLNEAATTSDVLVPVRTVPVTLRGQSTALALSPADTDEKLLQLGADHIEASASIKGKISGDVPLPPSASTAPARVSRYGRRIVRPKKLEEEPPRRQQLAGKSGRAKKPSPPEAGVELEPATIPLDRSIDTRSRGRACRTSSSKAHAIVAPEEIAAHEVPALSVQAPSIDAPVASQAPVVAPAKRKRGRPRKTEPTPEANTQEPTVTAGQDEEPPRKKARMLNTDASPTSDSKPRRPFRNRQALA
ncbi:hypothetical protein DFH11DRAFT_448131 [Phellopilus nigrolimitatus]|nr:hypothetical protein DFH11DRAFT_448131 [Phellopilus nigrolimitatus]